MLHRSLALARLELSAALFVAAASIGCAAPTAEQASSSDAELDALHITLGGSDGAVTVDDRPRLRYRARGELRCDDRFEIDGRVRLTCTRNDELLEVIVRPDEHEAVLVHRPEGRARDTRTFYACAISGNGPDGLPARLSCKKPAPHEDGGGGLASPFASTVPGIDIHNAHEVGSGGLLVRGMAPRSDADLGQLVAADVGAVLVFKNQTGRGTDVADEMDALVARGLPKSRVKNIPFPWKDLPDFEQPCRQTVQALSFLAENVTASHKTFFHCTVGEDRTGMLAAIHRLLTEPDLDAAGAWDREMCEHGYGAGNPNKPAYVLGELERGLEPLYRKLAYLVATGALSAGDLDEDACATDPEGAPGFAADALPLERLTCGTSTLFEP